ncbi:MAG: Na(+)-translocating NADH-quinone reductase subunit A [FCB group bacterium]|nr:Na(+)-translocating NADH-quinone reductase subunit A [FCB group bacterium]
MKHIRIKKGHDLRIAGRPEKLIQTAGTPRQLKVEPPNFSGIKPKLLVKEGDSVKIGTPLFYDKLHPRVKFTSPGGGVIAGIKFGERRRIEEIVIELSANEAAAEFGVNDSSALSADEIKTQLLESGLWPVIRQRPFSRIADPETEPKAIFISARPTAPFAPDIEFLLGENSEGFQAGLDILAKLTAGKVNLVIPENTKTQCLAKADNVELYTISGPHPAGNVGIQIHHIDPIRPGEIIWYVSVQDVMAIGRLFTKGQLSVEKVVCLGGSALSKNHYLKIRRGMLMKDILKNNEIAGEARMISGDVLTGRKTSLENCVGFYDEIISVIPEGRERKLLGWMRPGWDVYSLTNAFFSRLRPKEDMVLTTNRNGGVRAIVPFGNWESVLPMEILPTYLIKSILARDIDDMEKLGIYECDPEDFALCAFACTSKQEVSEIVREGLEYIETEG